MKIYETHCDVITAVTGFYHKGAQLHLIWTALTLHDIYFIQQMFVLFADLLF